MAKTKNSASAKAAAKTLAIAKRKKPATNNLVEKLENDEKPQSRKRELKRRSTDETIRKKVRDHFPGFTEAELTMRLLDGVNVYDRLRQDMKKLRAGELLAMGKCYYEEMRKVYRDPDGPLSALEPKDVNEEVDESLEDALTQLLESQKSTVEIHQWCENVTQINQLNLVALFRQLLKMPPVKSLENANIAISVLKVCLKLGIPENYPEEFNVVKGHMDLALVRSLQAYKQEEHSSKAWWDVNSEWARLILPYDAMKKVMEAVTDWQSVAKEVMEIHESSAVGRHIMAKAVRQLEIEGIGIHVKTALQELKHMEHITQASYDQVKARFVERLKLQGVDSQKGFKPRKEVMIEYRGIFVPIIVVSPIDHFVVATESFLRGVAVDLKLLPFLWCEPELLKKENRVVHVKKIEPKMLTAADAARKACMNALVDEFATAPTIEKLLKQKKNFLLSMDRCFRVEMAFWFGSMGKTANERVKGMILECLPESAEKKISLATSVRLFQQVHDCKLLAFAGASQQAMFKTVYDWVMAMGNGRNPEIEKAGKAEGFYLVVRQRMEHFFVCDDVTGAVAAKCKWDALSKEAAKKDSKVRYADFVPLLPFTWLLTKEDKAAMQTCIKQVMRDNREIGKASSSAGDSQVPAQKKQKTDARVLAKGLFKK